MTQQQKTKTGLLSEWLTELKDSPREAATATLSGAFFGALLNGCVIKMDTSDIPVDPALSRENTSLVNVGITNYAAIVTADGAQIFRAWHKSDNGKMELVRDPALAGDIAAEIAKRLGEAENDDDQKKARVLEIDTKNISVPFIADSNQPPVRYIPAAAQQADPALDLRRASSQQLWTTVHATVSSGRYDVPAQEKLPLGESAATWSELKNPKAIGIGALLPSLAILFFVAAERRRKQPQALAKDGPSMSKKPEDTGTGFPVTDFPIAASASERKSGDGARNQTAFRTDHDDDDNTIPVVIAAAVITHAVSGTSNSGNHLSDSTSREHESHSSYESPGSSGPGGSD